MIDRITPRQATLLMSLHFFGSAVLAIPSVLASIAGQDAWISALLAILLQLGIVPILAAIAKQMQGRHLTQHLELLMGKWVGKTVSIGYLILFPYLVFTLALFNMGDFLTTSQFPETSAIVLNALFLTAVVYIVRKGIQVLGRVAEFFFPFIAVLLCLYTIILIHKVELKNLEPLWSHKFSQLIDASYLIWAFPFMEAVVYLALIPYLTDARRFSSVIVKGLLFGGVVLTFVVVLSITTLGPITTASVTFPVYFMARTITLPNILERVEALVPAMWVVSIFFKVSFLLFVASSGMARTLSFSAHKFLVLPLALIGLTLGTAAAPNTDVHIESIKVYPLYTSAFGIAFPIVLYLLGLVRKRDTVK